jgi:UDP-glucose 4-epimerase
VIESVKRVSGVDFKVEFTGRRAGDPAQLVAALLNWEPRFDDLATIVSHALDWERRLQRVAVVSA